MRIVHMRKHAYREKKYVYIDTKRTNKMEMRRKLNEKGRERRSSQLVSRSYKMSLTSPFEKKSSRKQSSRTKISSRD
jgi:hypothetical protein